MRLTLRTLLAYLDDILEPAEAKEIGAKIAESSYASSLVTKIRDVVRRRRITAPEVSGPGSAPEPNIVAEYLDNTLAPESVADLERVCLESESHLAEVAACHQVLTLVLGEPVDVPSGMRERMYALGAVSPSEDTNGLEVKGSHVPSIAGVGAADITRDLRPGSGEVTLEDRLPEALLPKKRSWGRFLPYVAGVLVIAAWSYLIFNDEAFTGTFQGDSVTADSLEETELDFPAGQRQPVAAAEAGDDSEAIDDVAPGEVGSESAIPVVAVAAPDLTSTPPPMSADGTPIDAAADIPDVTITQQSPDPSTQQTIADASPETSPDVTPEADAFKPPVQQPIELAEPLPIQDMSTEGVLLQFKPAADDWFMLPRRSLIFPGEEVAAPIPFDANLSVGDGGTVATVTLRGGTRLRSLGATDDGLLGFELRQGRLVIHRKDSAPADEPLPLRLVIRGDVYKLELLQPGTIIGVEVIPMLPAGAGDRSGATRYNGGFSLVAGAGRLTSADGQLSVDLHPNAGKLDFLTTGDAHAVQPEPLVALPEWLDLESYRIPQIIRRYAAPYEDEFIPDQPISHSIRPVVKDRRPQLAEFSTQTLGLTGSYPGLVDALSSQHEESRRAAIIGLQQWLPLDDENGEQLQVELQNRFRPDDAAALERLLWGFGEQDARNQVTSQELVDWLGSDEIAIRELAFFHIHRLTDRTHDYRPNDPVSQRTRALKSWQRYVSENGSLIVN